jgi:hypothetical protein
VRERGLWARLSTHWYADPKVLGVSPEAELLYVRAIAWCKEMQNDGVIPAGALHLFDHKVGDGEACADELVKAGLWERLDDGWRFPTATWSRWQDTVEEVKARRAADRDRQRAHRASRNGES